MKSLETSVTYSTEQVYESQNLFYTTFRFLAFHMNCILRKYQPMTKWRKRYETKSLTAEALGDTGLASRPRASSPWGPRAPWRCDVGGVGGGGPITLCPLSMVLKTRWGTRWGDSPYGHEKANALGRLRDK